MRHNRSQTRQTRSHHALKTHSLIKCECGNMRVSHRACPVCGRYNGRIAVDLVAKTQARMTKRDKERSKSEAQKQK